MLGVAMLASFLVGYLSRALLAHHAAGDNVWFAAPCAVANLDMHRYRRRPWLAATGRSQSWPRPAARLACS